MTKKQKIEFINKTNERFLDARNHGHNGGNWWHPKQNIIAYNVKLHGTQKTTEDILEAMTERQKEYYTEDDLFNIMQEEQVNYAGMFSDELDEEFKVKSGYAGRSGGWLEVEYTNTLDEVDEDTDKETLNDYFETAKELEKKEAEVAQRIERGLESYKKYLNSDSYITDTVDLLLGDEEIANIYRAQAQKLINKLK